MVYHAARAVFGLHDKDSQDHFVEYFMDPMLSASTEVRDDNVFYALKFSQHFPDLRTVRTTAQLRVQIAVAAMHALRLRCAQQHMHFLSPAIGQPDPWTAWVPLHDGNSLRHFAVPHRLFADNGAHDVTVLGLAEPLLRHVKYDFDHAISSFLAFDWFQQMLATNGNVLSRLRVFFGQYFDETVGDMVPFPAPLRAAALHVSDPGLREAIECATPRERNRASAFDRNSQHRYDGTAARHAAAERARVAASAAAERARIVASAQRAGSASAIAAHVRSLVNFDTDAERDAYIAALGVRACVRRRL
jgi:hypothetical protein